MSKLLKIAVASAAIVGAMPASAAVIDFNAGFANAPSYTEQGVTFTATGGGNLTSSNFGNTPNGTPGIIGNPFSPIRATFSGTTDFVSVDIGDYNADADDIFLSAYDASNILLGQHSVFLPSSFTGMWTLSASFANIKYVEFGGRGFNGESNVYSDNFTFNSASVPEPATWGMMIAGFGLVGGAMRRRKAQVRVTYA